MRRRSFCFAIQRAGSCRADLTFRLPGPGAAQGLCADECVSTCPFAPRGAERDTRWPVQCHYRRDNLERAALWVCRGQKSRHVRHDVEALWAPDADRVRLAGRRLHDYCVHQLAPPEEDGGPTPRHARCRVGRVVDACGARTAWPAAPHGRAHRACVFESGAKRTLALVHSDRRSCMSVGLYATIDDACMVDHRVRVQGVWAGRG